jgi:hypothetical protein
MSTWAYRMVQKSCGKILGGFFTERVVFAVLSLCMKTTTKYFSKLATKDYRGPEFIPIPKRGGDSVFNLSRSFWYSLEAQGIRVFVRIRRPGNSRGRVMISVRRAFEVIGRLESAKRAGSTQPEPTTER